MAKKKNTDPAPRWERIEFLPIEGGSVLMKWADGREEEVNLPHLPKYQDWKGQGVTHFQLKGFKLLNPKKAPSWTSFSELYPPTDAIVRLHIPGGEGKPAEGVTAWLKFERKIDYWQAQGATHWRFLNETETNNWVNSLRKQNTAFSNGLLNEYMRHKYRKKDVLDTWGRSTAAFTNQR